MSRSVFDAASDISQAIATCMLTGEMDNSEGDNIPLGPFPEYHMNACVANVDGCKRVHVSLVENDSDEIVATYDYAVH